MAFTYLTVTIGSGVRDPGGAQMPAKVRFTPTAPDGMRNGTTTVGTVVCTVELDGTLSSPVAATDDPATIPADAAYLIEVIPRGADPWSFYAELPHDSPGGTVNLDDLVELGEAPTLSPLLAETVVGSAAKVAAHAAAVDPHGDRAYTDAQLAAFDLRLNVQDYGAAGDGITDDTAAIQSAWTALTTAGGGVLHFPRGDYLTTGLVFTGGSDFVIRGDGDARILLARATVAAPNRATHNVVTITDCTDFSVENVIIDGQRDVIAGDQYLTANASTGQPNITVQDGTKFVVGEMVWVMGGVGGAEKNRNDPFIRIASIVGNVLTLASNLTNSYTATGAAGGAFVTRYQTGDASSYTVAGRALGNEDAQNGLHLIACSQFRLAGNICRNVWESPIRLGVGISTNSPGDGCSDATVTGNRCFHGYDQGIAVWLSQRITVVGNTCRDAGWAGISFTHSEDCVASGNVCTDNLYSPASDVDQGVGMAIEGGERIALVGNVCSGNNRDGIRINRSPVYFGITTTSGSAAVGATSLTVADASFMAVGTSHVLIHDTDDTVRENIHITAKASNTVTLATPLRSAYPSGSDVRPRYNSQVTIAGNVCSANVLGAGIKIAHGIDILATQNTCVDNGLSADQQGTYGVEIRDESHGTAVIGNVCSRNSQDGISIDTVKRVTVANNTCNYNGVSGGQKNGIRNWNSLSDSVIQNNHCSHNTLNGIHLDPPGNRNTIAGNVCLDNHGRGIIAYAPSGGVSGLTIENNRCSFNNEPGIDLRGVKNSLLLGNDCSNNTQEGVRLDDNGSDYCTKNIVSNNLLYDDRSGGARTQPYGLKENGNTANTLVVNNRAYGNTASDLSLAGTSTSTGNVTGA